MDFFWEKRGWEDGDKHLKMLAKMPFQRKFPFIPTAEGLYIIRGPRQVGKSSWLKTILSHYSRITSCFYLSCEEIGDYRDLSEILKSVRDRQVVILDEVNYVENWDRTVKHAVDSGYSRLLIVTGSHAHDLKRGADRMPGRFDGGGEFHLLPMSFDEFILARKDAGWASSNRLDELRAYMRVGGFPQAVAEGGVSATIPQKAIDTYWRWLSGDFVRLHKSEKTLTELMVQLAICLQSPLSFNTLAKKTGIGSHNTVIEYIELLESCFALRSLQAIDIDTGALKPRKDRKFYFTDPLLYQLAFHLSGMKPPENQEDRLAEMIANEHLAQKFARFGYHGNEKGEVDFVLPTRWAIEVKWSPVASNLSKAYHNLRVPEKIVWTMNNILEDYPKLSPTILG